MIRLLLLFEAMTFIAAALIHAGNIVAGYEHHAARIAETVIAIVLLLGLLFTFLRPPWARLAAIWAQGIALVGTLIGVLAIIVGVGPRTVPDVIYHAAIVVVLGIGIAMAYRMGRMGEMG